MLLSTRLISFCCLAAFAGTALGDDVFIYPKNDQSMEQQRKDENECYIWAKGKTGFDPKEPPRTSRPPPPTSSGADGSMVRGAARGAVVGSIFDGSDGAGKGALAGAAIGGMRRNDRRREEQQDYDRWEQEEAARYQEQRSLYERANKACLEARDYSVT